MMVWKGDCVCVLLFSVLSHADCLDWPSPIAVETKGVIGTACFNIYTNIDKKEEEWPASYTDKWEWDKTCDAYQTSCWSMKKTIDPNDLTDDEEEEKNFDSCRINRWIDRQTNCDDDEGRANELINELLCLTSKQHVRRRSHQFISSNCLESLKHD